MHQTKINVMKEYYVYTHETVDGDIFWVGKGSRVEYVYGKTYDRSTDFRNRSEGWFEKVKKYGNPIVKYPYVNLTQDDALRMERELILELGIDTLCNTYIGMEKPEEWKQSRKGIPRSEQVKLKLREANLGKTASDETKKKMSTSRSGDKNHKAISVQCYLNGIFEKEYTTITSVKIDGFNPQGVTNCLKGRALTSGGRTWKYK